MAVEDGLERLGGVHHIDIDLQINLVTLRCGPATAVDLASVPRAIRDSGFRPDDLRIEARGRIDADGRTFTPDGWTSALALAPGDERAAGAVHLRASVVGWDTPAGVLALTDVVATPLQDQSAASQSN
ncbi:MAG: heavy metal-associated domain-containing protein [Planctomycetota bacterium]